MNTARLCHVDIRWMIRLDMPRVLEIERDSFEYFWDEQDFLDCLRLKNCIGMVATTGDRILPNGDSEFGTASETRGFMIYELRKARLRILNFAVAPEVRRESVGKQMIAKLIFKLSQQRRTEIAVDVREGNLAAQMFFASQGFRAVNVLRDYYSQNGEAAYRMVYRLGQVHERIERLEAN